MSEQELVGVQKEDTKVSTLQWSPSPCPVREFVTSENREPALGTYQNVTITSSVSSEPDNKSEQKHDNNSNKEKETKQDDVADSNVNALVGDVQTLEIDNSNVKVVEENENESLKVDVVASLDKKDESVVAAAEGGDINAVSVNESSKTTNGDSTVAPSDSANDDVIVYISSVSSNRELKKWQQRIVNVLDSKHIPYKTVDIAIEVELRAKMRELCQIPNALPPRFFKGDRYLGDYEAFDDAVEDGIVKQFLELE